MTNRYFDNFDDLNSSINSNNIIPTKWKKFGEVYLNELEQPVFICLVCLKKAAGITSVFNTSNSSAFLWHIQQHINEECETIDKISKEIRKFETNVNDLEALNLENNSRSAETTKLNKQQQQLKTLEIFHENLIKDNELFNNNAEIKLEYATNPNQYKPTQSTINKEFIKIEIKEEDDQKFKNKLLNCNYYYDNEPYTISDDDDEDDEEYEGANFVHTKIKIEREITNYLKNNVTIEISDDENDTYKHDDVNTIPTTPRFIKSETKNLDVDTTHIDPFNMFHWMKPPNIEDNVQFRHPINNIPTPEISPCETLANPIINTTFKPSDYNTDCGYVSTQSIIPPPKKRITAFRAYQCKICGSRTINEKNMLIHQQRLHNITVLEAPKNYHQIDQPYQDQPKILLEKENNISSFKKPFRCKTCKRRTKTEKSMKRHQQLYHSTNSNLTVKQCEICHKRIFSDKLQDHMLLHNGKGFKCNYCGVVYKQMTYLKLHVIKYHSDENSAQF